MNWKEYKKLSERTFSYIENLNKDINIDLAIKLNQSHCAIGIITELGELMTAIKNNDIVNVTEELGDICWYISNLERLMGNNDQNLIAFKGKIKSIDIGDAIVNASNLLDIYKKGIYYNKQVNYIEVTDVLELIKDFVSKAAKLNEKPMHTVLSVNINKLRLRFPNKFTEKDAIERDTDAEYKLMQNQINK